jgi:hypothetical protein
LYPAGPELALTFFLEATLAHLIVYKFAVGQSTRYTHTTYMSLTLPGQEERLYGHISFLRNQTVIEQCPQGYELEIQQQMVDKQGVLCDHIPTDLEVPSTRMQMDVHGRILSQPSAGPKVASFPEHQVQEGDSWTVQDPSGLNIQFYLEKLETVEGEILAHFATQGEGQGSEGDDAYTIEVGSKMLFSISRGCQVRAKSLITQTWKSGKVMETLVESELQPD